MTSSDHARAKGSRAVRPFPTMHLLACLAGVNDRAIGLNQNTMTVVGNMPWDVIGWCQSLQLLRGSLDSLIDEAEEAKRVCDKLFDQAPRDYEAAQRAALALLTSGPLLSLVNGKDVA